MYLDHRLGRLFARCGMVGYWKDEYATKPLAEVAADLVARKAPPNHKLFTALQDRRREPKGRKDHA